MSAIRALVDSIANPALWDILLPIFAAIVTIWCIFSIAYVVQLEVSKHQEMQLRQSKEIAKQQAYRYINSNNTNTKSRLELTKLQERGY